MYCIILACVFFLSFFLSFFLPSNQGDARTHTHTRTHAANEEDPQGFFAMGIRGVLCVLSVCVCIYSWVFLARLLWLFIYTYIDIHTDTSTHRYIHTSAMISR